MVKPSCEVIELVRLRQIKNMMTTLLMSQGVPMIVAGDEIRRTQLGNNNAYCQDNEISWFDWSLVDHNRELFDFCQDLIRFRRDHETIRQTQFLSGGLQAQRKLPDLSWYNAEGGSVDWSEPDSSLTCLLVAPLNEEEPKVPQDILLFLNPSSRRVTFSLPAIAQGKPWRMLLNTAESGFVKPAAGNQGLAETHSIELQAKTMAVFVCEHCID